MDLRKAIRTRRTIRNYNDKEVTRGEIIELLNDAVYAPTHKLRQTWRFILIDGEDKQKLIENLEKVYDGVDPKEAQLEYRKKSLIEAKVILIIVNEKNNPNPIWMLEEYGASCALIQNLQLLSFAKGIGVCWKSHFFIGKPEKFFGIKENEMIAGVLTIGKFDNVPKVQARVKAEDKLTIFKYTD